MKNKNIEERIEIIETEEVTRMPFDVGFRLLKVPHKQTDDFGNETIVYRKEYVSLENLDTEIEALQVRIDILKEKRDLIVDK